MTTTLTVGYDGSPAAARAVEFGAELAERDRALLRVISCFTTPGVVDPWYVGVPVDIERVRANAERDLAGAVAVVQDRHPGLRVEAVTLWGSPREQLVECARDSALLIVGTSGAGRTASLILGSVAHAVARTSVCPVVLVPDVQPPGERGRVVVGIDGSIAAQHALDWAIAEADRRDAELIVVHAWQYEYPGEITAPEGRDLLRVDAARVLDRAVEHARDIARMGVRGELVEQAPAEALLTLGSIADLLVVGTRGRGALRSALFGSVAHAVAERAACPVAIVRDQSCQANRAPEEEAP